MQYVLLDTCMSERLLNFYQDRKSENKCNQISEIYTFLLLGLSSEFPIMDRKWWVVKYRCLLYRFIPLIGEQGLLVCIFTFQYISLLHCKF